MHIQLNETVEYKRQIILNIPKGNVHITYTAVTPRGISSSTQMPEGFGITPQSC